MSAERREIDRGIDLENGSPVLRGKNPRERQSNNADQYGPDGFHPELRAELYVLKKRYSSPFQATSTS